jgi:hypothetical protein
MLVDEIPLTAVGKPDHLAARAIVHGERAAGCRRVPRVRSRLSDSRVSPACGLGARLCGAVRFGSDGSAVLARRRCMTPQIGTVERWVSLIGLRWPDWRVQ